jgi:hypothetical protein
MFVELFLWRNILKPRKRRGRIENEPEIVEIPVTGILGKPERLVLVLGEAGAGKSTSIRRLAYVLAGKALSVQTGLHVPVLLRATDLAQNPRESLLEAALAETKKISASTKPAFESADLLDGRVVFLIDALDEVAEDSDRKEVLALIRSFHEVYPRCLVVLTSREYAFLKNLPELAAFTRYRVEQISFRQAEKMVEKLEKKGSLPVDTSKELIRRLEQVHGMDLNPLLVTVFAATTEYARQDIPANITELFKKFTEMMLGRWDATKGLAHQFHAPLKDFMLTKIAFDMHQARVTGVALDEFRSRIAAELRNRGYEADIDQLVDEILNRSGLLRVVGDRVEFRHLLLQEFYAGRGIPSEDLLEAFIFDDWWRRAIVFYFGERPSNAAAISKIRSVVPTKGAAERFTAAGTLGLALQACYLMPVTDKINGILDVIENISDVKDDVVGRIAGAAKFPLTGFLVYYLNARDSVALASLGSAAPSVIERYRSFSRPRAEIDIREFWLIVGLLEAGLVTEAETLMRQFHPADTRLLLAIHLGCSLIQQIRVSAAEQKKSARRICERLDEKISNLRRQVFDEFRTHLIEIRRGEITGVSEGQKR